MEGYIKKLQKTINADDLLYRSGLFSKSKAVEVGKNAYIYQNASFAAYN
jgi:hypothetical protein